MKKFYVFLALCTLASLTLMGCQRNEGVFAGNDSSVYKPRPAPPTDELQGELLRVNGPGKSVELRIENGLIQTFRYDEHTVVSGLEDEPTKPVATGKSGKVIGPLAALVGKEGSEVVIRFTDQNDDKLAKTIDVMQVYTNKPAGRSRRH